MSSKLIPTERIESKILLIRDLKVMVDRDLAQLYQVPTKRLNEQVKRNLKRFPLDFIFQMTRKEFENWKSHFATSNKTLRSQFATSNKRGGRQYLPYVFTQDGVVMLSSVLNSDRAIEVNIQIMRTFTKLREILANHKDLARKIEYLEKKYDSQFRVVFEAIRRLIKEEEKPKVPIGFHVRA